MIPLLAAVGVLSFGLIVVVVFHERAVKLYEAEIAKEREHRRRLAAMFAEFRLRMAGKLPDEDATEPGVTISGKVARG